MKRPPPPVHPAAASAVSHEADFVLAAGSTSPRVRRPALFIPLGVLGLAGAAQLAIPIDPVPLTMQTYAVVMVGALGGARLGFATCAAYLAAAALGAPILADGESGWNALAGVTGGYLVAFPIAAAFVGALEEQNRAPSTVWSFLGMLGGHAITLAIGTTWLGSQIGASDAVSGGLTPFIPGAVIKSALAAGTLLAIRAAARRRRARAPQLQPPCLERRVPSR